MSLIRLPFRRLDTQQWLRLVWIGLAIFYILYAAGAVWSGRVFDYMGSDYRAFYASAEIAWEHGLPQIYDLQLQQQYQQALTATYSGSGSSQYGTGPMYYLPIFVLPFLLLRFLPPLPGFILWTGLNAVALLLYLRRLFNAWGNFSQSDIWFRILFSAPVFTGLFFGQVNVWLFICLGEFLLSIQRGRDFQGGLWLAGLLLKPQAVFLLLPGLLLNRRIKSLVGTATVGLLLGVISLLMVGPPGLWGLVRQFLSYPSGLTTTFPHLMMNWRVVGYYLAVAFSAGLAAGVAYPGMALTALAGLFPWIRPSDPTSPRFGVLLLGIMAATSAVAWHSHVHMAILLLLPLLLLTAQGRLPRIVLELWLLLPTLLFPAFLFFRPDLAHNAVGLGLFALNLAFVGWSAWAAWPFSRRAEGRHGEERPTWLGH